MPAPWRTSQTAQAIESRVRRTLRADGLRLHKFRDQTTCGIRNADGQWVELGVELNDIARRLGIYDLETTDDLTPAS